MRFKILIALLLFYSRSYTQNTLFKNYEGWSYTLKNAAKDNKINLLYFGASWCTPCKQLEKNVFTDSGVIRKLADSFNCYKFDIDFNNAISFLKKYRIINVPVIILLDKEGYLIERIENIEQEKSAFPDQMHNGMGKRGLYPGVSNQLLLPYPAFYNLFFDAKVKKTPDSIEVDNYLRSQNSLFTEVNWSVLTLFNSSDYFFEFVLSERKRFAALFGPEVPFKVFHMYRNLANKYISLRDSVSYNRVGKMMIESVNTLNYELSIRTYLIRELKFLGMTGIDWDSFKIKSAKFISTYGTKHNQFILNYAYNTDMDRNIAEVLVELLKSTPDEMPFSQIFFEYGILCFKSGDKKLADRYFGKCIENSLNEEQRSFFTRDIEKFKTGKY